MAEPEDLQENHRARITDSLFGDLEIAVDRVAGRVAVRGEGVPEAVIERIGDGPTVSWVPIGTRDPAALVLRVGGAAHELRPSKGGLTRRSYQVRARLDGTDLLLTPSSPTTARLVRGERYRGDNELGTFERVADVVVPAVWRTEASPASTTQTLRAEPAEAAVGYALAAAFGTGARFFLAALLEGAGTAAPA